MLRCLGSVPVRTGTRPGRAEETCTCNVCSSPRAWERVGSAPVSWIGPRSSRHPTSLKAASGRGMALGCLAASRRWYSERVSGAERPRSRCLQYRCGVAAPRSVGSDSLALRDEAGASFTSSRQAPQAALAKDAKGGRRGLRGVRLARQGWMRSTSPVPTEMLPMET